MRMNIFKLHQDKPTRLGHKRARKNKLGKMEAEGQLNLFHKPATRIISMPQKRGFFEQALRDDENGSSNARQAYLQAIKNNDRKADALCNLGVIEARDSNDVKAINCFSKALVEDPRHFEAHFNLGNIYFDNENYPLAQLHYKTALEIDPDDPNIYFNLGLVQALQGNNKEAIDSLSAYSKMVGKKESSRAVDLVNQLTNTTKI
jgi:tetratricopeptide (TPR) repeat protein